MAKELKESAQSKKKKDPETKAKRKSDATGFAEAASAFEAVTRKSPALDDDQIREPQRAETKKKKDLETTAKRKSDATGFAEAANELEAVARNSAAVDDVRIRERAYTIWIEEGRPHGRDLEHWQRARDEFKGA